MEFWIIAGLIFALVAGVLALAALRARQGASQTDSHMQIYRDQLAEVERDAERGTLDAESAERLRLEVSRRLLDADRQRKKNYAAKSTNSRPILAWGIVVVLLLGSGLIYNRLGAPNYPDLPLSARLAAAEEAHANRPSQADAEAQAPSQSIEDQADPSHLELMQKLRTVMETRPDDLQGHILLAQNEAILGNFAAAQQAQGAVLRLMGDTVAAGDIANYVDLLVLAAGGYVSPQAEAAIVKTLEMQPENGTGRYYLGLMYAQTGRPDLAFEIWQGLLETSSPDAPWIDPIRDQIEFAAQDAGIQYSLPALAPGPSQADIAAAADLSAEERTDFIRSMVNQLSDRLAESGGTAAEWSRLITALGVLGETDRAQAIWAESRGVFAADPEALQMLDSAAQQAGLTQ